MRNRFKIVLLLGAVALALLSRREIYRLVVVRWGQFLNELLQTELESSSGEDPTLSLVQRRDEPDEREVYRAERVRHLLRNPAGYPMHFGKIWNWVRRSKVMQVRVSWSA